MSNDGLLQKIKTADQVKQATSVDLGGLGEFRGALRPFQTVGVAFAMTIERGLIADACGMGKTVQALAVIAKVRALKEDERPIVIFCQGRGLRQWESEFKNFLGFRPRNLHNYTARQRRYVLSRQPEILLVNYEMFVRHPSLLDEMPAHLVIVDEVSALKSHEAKTAAAIKRYVATANRVLALSATPIETRLADIHSVLEVAGPIGGIFPSWPEFKRRYVITRRIKGVKFGRMYDFEVIDGYRDLPTAASLVAPFMIRRVPGDVGEQLPEVVSRIEEFEMHPDQARAYAKIKRSADGGINAADLHEAQQLVDFYVDGGRVISPKMDYVVDLLSGDLQHAKCIIHATHLNTLRLITMALGRAKVSYAVMDGSVDYNTRFKIQTAFNEDEHPRVLVADDVIKDTLNLPAAQYMFLMDVPTNPKRLEQIVGRMRRMTSAHQSVIVTMLVMEDTHEDHRFQVLNYREKLTMYIMGDSNSSLVGSQSEGDLLEALQ